MSVAGAAAARCGKELPPPAPVGWWRNAGRRLGVLPSPGSEEVVTYIEPGDAFPVARVATLPGGRRYLQLADGGGWVPERSRKDPSKVVAVHIADPKDAIPGEPASVAADAAGSGPGDAEAGGEGPAKRRRLSPEEAAKAQPPPSASAAVSVRYLRFTVLATRSRTNSCMQVAEVALRCRGRVLGMAGFTAESANSSSPLSEGPERLLGSMGKFLDSNFRTHGRSVFVLTAPKQLEIEDVALRTPNDNPSRDPVHFVVDGSRDGLEWTTLLDTGAELPCPLERKAWTPWFALEEQGPARQHALPEGSEGVRRFYCTARPCKSYQASTEGYLVEGKLLRHMLRDHPRSAKTAELSVKLRGTAEIPQRRRRHERKGRAEAAEEPLASLSSSLGIADSSPGGASSAATRSGKAVAAAAASSSSSSSSSSSEGEEEPAPPAATAEAAAVSGEQGSHPETPRRGTAEAADSGSLLTPSPPVARAAGLSQQMRGVLARAGGSHAAEVVDALAGEPADELLEALAAMSPLPSPPPSSPAKEEGQGPGPGAGEALPIAELDSLQRYPPVEGTVEHRWERRCDGSFGVRLRDPSGAVEVTFLGRAAEAFRGEPSLREGARARIRGYDLVPVGEEDAGAAGRRYELVVGSVHAGVGVSVPGGEAALPAAAPRCTHLRDLSDVALHGSIDVEAVVHFVGRLTSAALPELGAAAATAGSVAAAAPPTAMRALLVRQDKAVCSLVLRGALAEGHGSELVGKSVIARGARVIEFKGKRHLSGCRRLEFSGSG